jgi:large subunit ribosomal protein L17
MRHLKTGRKLNRSGAHRVALFRNLVTALIRHERIRTTDAKAKELRSVAERMVTLGKQATLHARRRAFDKIRDRDAVQKLFRDLAPRFAERAGGYTRIIKLGLRPGDAAAMSLVEWCGSEKEAKRPKKKPKAPAKATAKQTAAPRKRAAAG